MQVRSFVHDNLFLKEIEVELSLIPGLPATQIVGLPDSVTKESIWRIKSAFNALGFEWPQSHQIIVNLRPLTLRKKSEGLELAIALAILWATEQIPKLEWSCPYVYGQLGLDGRIYSPEDISDLDEDSGDFSSSPLITGDDSPQLEVPCMLLNKLSDLKSLDHPILPAKKIEIINHPKLPHLNLTPKQARIVGISALGEHSLLLAGRAGTGKSTIAKLIPFLLKPPTPEEFREIRRIHRNFGEPIKWRPLSHPHHSITLQGMVGGGSVVRPGEVTRAHRGVLLLDEYLEFNPKVQEALREPIEAGRLTVTRVNESKTFPCQFLLVATTNLCMCGEYIPKATRNKCRCLITKRRNYLARLSGPMLDRFQILALSDAWENQKQNISIQEVYNKVSKARLFPREKWCLKKKEEILLQMPSLNGLSLRRQKSFLQVLTSILQYEQKENFDHHDLQEAFDLTVAPFELLRLGN